MQCKTVAMSAKLTFFRESFHKEFQISFLEASLIYYSKAKKLGPSKCLSQVLHVLPITLVNSFLLKIHKIWQGSWSIRKGPSLTPLSLDLVSQASGHFFWDDFVGSISIANLCSLKVSWHGWLTKHLSQKWHFKTLVVQSIFQLYTGKMKDLLNLCKKQYCYEKWRDLVSFWIQGCDLKIFQFIEAEFTKLLQVIDSVGRGGRASLYVQKYILLKQHH